MSGNRAIVEAIAELIHSLLDQGTKPPIYLVAVAGNGSMVFLRYVDGEIGLDAEELADHIEGDGFVLPINMMFTTKKGEAYRGLIDVGGPLYPPHR